MKIINAFFLYALLLSVLLIFTSCNNDTAPANTPYKSNDGAIYENKFYYLKNDNIVYVSLSDESTELFNLCSDPLCSHRDNTCPNYFVSNYAFSELIIDKSESDKNGSYPVFYVSTSEGTKNQIVRFNSKNNTREVVIDNIANPINQFWMYNDKIFFLCPEGDAGYNIYMSDKNGAEPKMLENNDNMHLLICGITDDKIFYCDYEGNIYMSPHDLSSKSLIYASLARTNVYLYDNKLFFADDVRVAQNLEGYDFLCCNIYYIDLTDASMTPVLAIENVSYMSGAVVFQSNNLLFYCTTDNISYIKTLQKYDSIEQKTREVKIFNDGTSVIYVYDILTGESRKIIDDPRDLLGPYRDADDEYFICLATPYDVDDIDEFGPTYLNIFNYKDGTKKTIEK